MSKLISSIVSRLRGRREQRQAPRHELQLEAHIQTNLSVRITLLDERQTETTEAQRKAKLVDGTRNISETGLAIVIPSLRVGERHLTDENSILQITLETYSAGLIELEAEIIHYKRLDEDNKYVGYLIGVKITKMSDNNRSRYLKYLNTLKHRAIS